MHVCQDSAEDGDLDSADGASVTPSAYNHTLGLQIVVTGHVMSKRGPVKIGIKSCLLCQDKTNTKNPLVALDGKETAKWLQWARYVIKTFFGDSSQLHMCLVKIPCTKVCIICLNVWRTSGNESLF